MKVMIDISNEDMDKVQHSDGAIFADVYKLMANAIRNGTPLNGTNGEVLLRMFPPSVYFPSEGTYMVLLTKDCLVSCSNVEWWNAEYKGVE